MGTASVNILIFHFKQNVSHFMPEHIFGAVRAVRISRITKLPPQVLFRNPRFEMDTYYTLRH